jgi:hypothetical protein
MQVAWLLPAVIWAYAIFAGSFVSINRHPLVVVLGILMGALSWGVVFFLGAHLFTRLRGRA